MKLREYQAKRIFQAYGLEVPAGEIADTAEQAAAIAARLGGPVVIKPQLGIKGRGKAGGIRFAGNPDEARQGATELLGAEVRGETVHRLLVEQRLEIAEELYVAVAIDPSAKLPVLVASKAGGVEIEQVAREHPEQVLRQVVSISHGPQAADLEPFRTAIGADLAEVLNTLYRVFAEHDAEMVEVNPLIRTPDGRLVAADGVLNIDHDAVFRHDELASLAEEIPVEDKIAEEARQRSWTYIELDGDIGILSSGAGLTMAILDLLHRAGGQPANFLDTAQIDDEGIYDAFALLARAKPVRAILVNIFAGLNRCDRLAEGMVRYLEEHPSPIPIVVRMVGNRQDEGYEILRRAGIEPVAEIEQAITQLMAAIGGAR